jgi:hypothetical protein
MMWGICISNKGKIFSVENGNGPDFSRPSLSDTPRQNDFVLPSYQLDHFTIFLQSKTKELKQKIKLRRVVI